MILVENPPRTQVELSILHHRVVAAVDLIELTRDFPETRGLPPVAIAAPGFPPANDRNGPTCGEVEQLQLDTPDDIGATVEGARSGPVRIAELTQPSRPRRPNPIKPRKPPPQRTPRPVSAGVAARVCWRRRAPFVVSALGHGAWRRFARRTRRLSR